MRSELDISTFEITYNCTLYHKVEYFSIGCFELNGHQFVKNAFSSFSPILALNLLDPSLVCLQLDCRHTATDSDQSRNTADCSQSIKIAFNIIQIGDSTLMSCEMLADEWRQLLSDQSFLFPNIKKCFFIPDFNYSISDMSRTRRQ